MDTFGALGTEVDQVVVTHGRARLSADKCMMPPGVDVGQSDFDIDQQTLARAFAQGRYRHGVVGIEFLTGECLVTLVILIVAALMLAALLFTQEQGLLVGVALLLEVDRAVVGSWLRRDNRADVRCLFDRVVLGGHGHGTEWNDRRQH
jgi:hypothetical protein